MTNGQGRILNLVLRNAPILLFFGLLVCFGLLSDRFFSIANFRNILIQSAPIAILAIGMTFLLLTAQIDLSVGAIMYVTACVLAIYVPHLPWPISALLAAVLATGIGVINGLTVIRFGVTSFIVTLSSLFILRGLAMWMSKTRTLPFPDTITDLNRATVIGIPSAVVAFGAVLLAAWILLNMTPLGRQIYAVGEDREAARKAGLPVNLIVLTCFALNGLCAGIGGFVSITQIGAIGPKYGDQIEFAAIAAAVLGGVSLFGGRGGVLGTVFGAILIKTTQNGLNIINADPYVYPLVTASIIFVAVALDGLRTRILAFRDRRRIRPMEVE